MFHHNLCLCFFWFSFRVYTKLKLKWGMCLLLYVAADEGRRISNLKGGFRVSANLKGRFGYVFLDRGLEIGLCVSV